MGTARVLFNQISGLKGKLAVARIILPHHHPLLEEYQVFETLA